LPDALSISERSVQGSEGRAAKFTLANLTDADLSLMRELGAQWDTLGWIQFKLGNLDAAERYLLPAWMLTHNPEVGRHVAELHAARKNTPEAELFDAIATMLSGGGGTVTTTGGGGGSTRTSRPAVPDAGNREAAMRSVDVPRLPGAAGSADVLVLLDGTGKVEDVRFTSGDTRLRPLAETLRDRVLPSRAPAGSDARLVRRVNLACAPGTGPCVGILIKVDDVRSVK
jgi:hypothetical protein